MSFTFPHVLYALGFLSIPILIHLFNFRRYKVIRFSQVSFLKEVKHHTKSSSQLKHLLVLIARLLAFSCLVIAFAKPYLSTKDQLIDEGKKGVSIYIDNSYSMSANAEQGQLLDMAKNKVIEILAAYKESDKFQLISNHFDATEQNWSNKEQIKERLQNIKLSAMARLGSEVLNRQFDLASRADFKTHYYFISDLQAASFDYTEFKTDSTLIRLIPVQSKLSKNISLDSLWLNSPYQLAESTLKMQFRMRNFSDENAIDLERKLRINEQLKAPSRVSIPANESMVSEINFKLSRERNIIGELIIRDYPINFDDTLYFNSVIQEEAAVLHLYQNEANSSLTALFANDSFFVYRTNPINQLDFTLFSSQDLIILDEIELLSSGLADELKRYLISGGSLALIPSEDIDLETYRTFSRLIGIDDFIEFQKTAMEVGSLNNKAELYQAVFDELPKQLNLPKTKAHWKLSSKSSVFREGIMNLANGESFLCKYQIKKGQLYLLSSPLNKEFSNFTEHALFVPSFYNMALIGKNEASLYYELGATAHFQNNQNPQEALHLRQGNLDLIPAQQNIEGKTHIKLSNTLLKPGHYQVMQAGKQVGVISLNHNRFESDIRLLEVNDLEDLANSAGLHIEVFKEMGNNLSQVIKKQAQGVQLWKYFLISALVFLGFEILLLRLMK